MITPYSILNAILVRKDIAFYKDRVSNSINIVQSTI